MDSEVGGTPEAHPDTLDMKVTFGSLLCSDSLPSFA